jgi:hypothetical protein
MSVIPRQRMTIRAIRVIVKSDLMFDVRREGLASELQTPTCALDHISFGEKLPLIGWL